MGTIISQLKSSSNQKSNCLLLGENLAKIRDYHGSYKSISDTFSIDLTEFVQIFGSNESAFVIWDTDDNGLIDALELFCGLIIFSDSKFDDKVRFLFDLFDFNELASLSSIDIEFMMHACITSTFKIYSISTDFNENEITDLVTETFKEDNRVNITNFMKWAIKTNEIQEFFAVIKKESSGNKNNNQNYTNWKD